jgi:protoheme IX farnesyltransferase
MPNKHLFRYHAFVATATLVLIMAGGLVTSTGSGLSVPDWPLSYGKFFPPMIGGIRFEHSHRVIAGFVGLCTLALSITLQCIERRRWVKILGWIASLAVLAQALLGGITVIYLLPTAVSVTHACLAQSFFSLIACLTLFQTREWFESNKVASASAKSFQRLIVTTACFAFLQLVAGAIVRHTHGAGLSYHLFGAFMVFIHTLFVLIKSSKDDPTRKLFQGQSLLVFGLVLFQLFLGLGSYVFKYYVEKQLVPTTGEVFFTTAHQTLGALILMNLVVMSLRSFRLLGGSSERDLSSEYLDLMKLKIILLASLTTGVGYFLGSQGSGMGHRMFHTLMGAFLIGGGANALNQYLERDIDKKMKRTENRPIPSGHLPAKNALIFGWVIALLGLLEIFLFVDTMSGWVGMAIFVGYAFIYTHLKKTTTWNTYVGAVAGALPILLGWVASTRSFSLPGWTLFAILFVWQLPHFYAIAWLYREDYRSGGLMMAPVFDTDGRKTAGEIVAFTLLLFFVSLLPYWAHIAGGIYLAGALILGVALTWLSIRLRSSQLREVKPFVASTIYYLIALILLMVLDKI